MIHTTLSKGKHIAQKESIAEIIAGYYCINVQVKKDREIYCCTKGKYCRNYCRLLLHECPGEKVREIYY